MGQRHKYENKNPLYRFAVRMFLSRVAEAVNEVQANKILDVACAEGFVIKYLKERQPEIVFQGFDIDADAIREAQKMNPGVSFAVKDLYTLAPKERFDLIIALEVLEHLEDYQRALKILHSLDAAHFLFSVPREPFFRGINFLRGRHWRRWGNIPEHINTWTKGGFKKVISPYFTIVGDFSSFPWTILLLTKK